MYSKIIFLAIACTAILLSSCSKKEKVQPVKPPVVKIDTLQSGTYSIASVISYPNKALTIQASPFPDAAQLNAGRAIDNSNFATYNNEQKWKITRLANNYYKIISAFSGLALDLPKSGNALVQEPPANTDSQLWKITYNTTSKAYNIINKSSLQNIILNKGDTANHTLVGLDTTAQYSWRFSAVKSGNIDTATTHSASMNKDIKAIIVTPATYGDGRSYPVVYMLHGYGDNYLSYLQNAPQIRDMADEFGVIIVCADGAQSCWWLNSVNFQPSQWQYETYISSELVAYTDAHYKTITDRAGRGILGLSMGGHGALYNAIKHQDVYSAAGSMSGCVDLTVVGANSLQGQLDFGIGSRLGPYSGATKVNWVNNSVINMVDQLKPDGSLALNFDCGEYDTDGFYPMNNALDAKLTAKNIPHTYTHRPGIHAWNYWNTSIPQQFAFLASHLQKAK